MKLIQFADDGKVTNIISVSNTSSIEKTAYVPNIPEYEQREGFSGILKYSLENGLYWDYIANPTEDETEISDSELGAMVKEVL